MVGRFVSVVAVGVLLGCSGDGRDLADPAPTVARPPAATSPTATSIPASVTAVDETASDVDASHVSTPGDTTLGGEPVGFSSVAATITTASGEVCELCLWLADSPALRSQGLMGVTDLGVADGMVFRYTTPTSTSFWMKDTHLPLSIAFFDGDGEFVDAFDMEPCTADPCNRYSTPNGFLDAIEFPQGTLDEYGAAPGGVLSVSDLPCART